MTCAIADCWTVVHAPPFHPNVTIKRITALIQSNWLCHLHQLCHISTHSKTEFECKFVKFYLSHVRNLRESYSSHRDARKWKSHMCFAYSKTVINYAPRMRCTAALCCISTDRVRTPLRMLRMLSEVNEHKIAFSARPELTINDCAIVHVSAPPGVGCIDERWVSRQNFHST
jgi:hypothetical protein